MKEKIISEINLDLVFQFNDFSQFSNKLKDTKTKLIFESIFWEKVFLSWINTILKKEDYKLSRDLSEVIGKDRTSVGPFFCIHFLFKEAIS